MTARAWVVPSRIERRIVMLLWRLLVRRGWAVQLNPPELCHSRYTNEEGDILDAGWRPLFSIRFGHTPIYRGPGEVRWVER